MKYVNIPEKCPPNVRHEIFYSALYGHELGYMIYLPAGYERSNKTYPVHYHLHGWQGSERSDVAAMERIYQNSETIYVFPNISDELGEQKALPVERMLLEEMIPEIERKYPASGAGKTISGFSMGGGMALYFALRHPGMFSDVIAYAGTFHHYYHKDFMTAFEPVERAAELYEGMKRSNWESERNLLALLDKTPLNAFRLILRVGSKDPLYCDAEVLHRHLQSLQFPHDYMVLEGAEHFLAEIV